MTKIMYRTGRIACQPIERREVVKTTPKTVTFLMETGWIGVPGKLVERKEARSSDWAQWHETWADAHAYLISEAERKVQYARLALQSAQGHLGNINGLREPGEGQ